ncbi:MAG: PepSY-like domain-containing protein [Bacteroidia bacterium]|nr:PepSY-like domain-containing protein [Bacteroidia bacterium]NNM22511.1 hypothetical protein [Flavobacteriaceae bacterium]
MKSISNLLAAVLLAISTSCSSGKIQVPEVVTQAFGQKYPQATEVEWEQDENMYEVEFELQKIEYTATYNARGKWVGTEHQITLEDLPTAARTLLQSKYSEYRVVEVEAVEDPDGNKFEVEINGNAEVLDLLFSEEGRLLKTEKDDEDPDEDDGEDDDGKEENIDNNEDEDYENRIMND